ncbi:MAG: DedA family protein [bacterium]|nr:DedA family protein [bacterium]
MDSYLVVFLTAWQPLGYLLAFFGMIVEGDIFLFAAAFLTSRGLFDPLLMFAALFSGVIFGDVLWYGLGILACRAPRLGRCINALSCRFDSQLLRHPWRMIFVSKFIYGIHHVLLIRLGMAGMNFRRFLKMDLSASLGWIAVVGGLGYLSGASFALIEHYVRFVEFALLATLALFLFFEYFAVRLLRPKSGQGRTE